MHDIFRSEALASLVLSHLVFEKIRERNVSFYLKAIELYFVAL
jgi:hypothetical protein